MELRDGFPRPVVLSVQEFIEPVYRYHLSRCEDYFEAQYLTVYTLRAFARWMEAHHPGGADEIKIRVMGYARNQQAYGRRHAVPPGFELPDKTAAGHAGDEISNDWPDQTTDQGTSFEVDLAEVALRNQMTQLSRTWKQLPRLEGDALALYFFAGLDLAVTAKILNKSETEIGRLLTRQANVHDELFNLARGIHPDRQFVDRLKTDIETVFEHPQSSYTRAIDLFSSRFYQALRRIGNSGKRLGQAGLLVGIMAAGLFIILNQPSTGGQAITPTPTGATSAPVQAASVDNRGNLVPPNTAVCQQWQAALQETTGQDITLTQSAFDDPIQSSPNANGTGCLLQAKVIESSGGGAWPVFNSVSQLLAVNHFTQESALNHYYDSGRSDYFGQGCFGMEKTLVGNNIRAILSVSWCPPDPNSQNHSETGQPFYSQSRASIQWMAHNFSPFTLKIILASNSVETILNSIFKQWTDGSAQVIGYLSPELLKRFPTLATLDRLAGINRISGRKVVFDWTVINNSGTDLRLAVTTSDVEGDGTPGKVLNRFQVALVQSNGTWVVQDMGQRVPFS